MSDKYYLNEDKTATPCDLETWSAQYEIMARTDTKHVAKDRIQGYLVSTVWLGLDHSYDGGEPEIFETMIFDKDSGYDIYMDRYSTWAKAQSGHQKAIEWLEKYLERRDQQLIPHHPT